MQPFGENDERVAFLGRLWGAGRNLNLRILLDCNGPILNHTRRLWPAFLRQCESAELVAALVDVGGGKHPPTVDVGFQDSRIDAERVARKQEDRKSTRLNSSH